MSVDKSAAAMARRQMEADLHGPHHLAREVAIAKIALAKIDMLHAVGEIFQTPAGKVVGDSHPGAGRHEPIDQMTADKRRAAGNEHSDVFPIHRFEPLCQFAITAIARQPW